MIFFDGYTESGNVLVRKQKEIEFRDLPGKGFARDMDSVGLMEPVIIRQSSWENPVIAGYNEAEIERRAYVLNADINIMEIPPNDSLDQRKFRLWFSPKNKSVNH